MKSLCLSLAKAESEQEVINIIRKAGYWDNQKNWKFYRGIENNFSVIGNQQSLPESAIVEKIINSVDAMLTRECLRRKIDPEACMQLLEMILSFLKDMKRTQGVLRD